MVWSRGLLIPAAVTCQFEVSGEASFVVYLKTRFGQFALHIRFGTITLYYSMYHALGYGKYTPDMACDEILARSGCIHPQLGQKVEGMERSTLRCLWDPWINPRIWHIDVWIIPYI